jgi:hypothetical protein
VSSDGAPRDEDFAAFLAGQVPQRVEFSLTTFQGIELMNRATADFEFRCAEMARRICPLMPSQEGPALDAWMQRFLLTQAKLADGLRRRFVPWVRGV